MTKVLMALVLMGGMIGLTAQQAESQPVERTYVVETGTRILLNLLNSVSTKTAAEGDRVYLATGFPVLLGGRVVVPPGSYVAGTVTSVKRAGKMKGRAELYVRFDSLTLPNGVTRDFRSRPGSLDGSNKGELDRTEGKIKGDSDKIGDTSKVGTGAGWGAMVGGISSGAKGAGIGAAAGAAAGLIGVMMSRGPDAMLERGTTLEMVLDRDLSFTADELDFGTAGSADGRRAGDGLNRRK
jgi:type IV secretion system protein VirB10